METGRIPGIIKNYNEYDFCLTFSKFLKNGQYEIPQIYVNTLGDGMSNDKWPHGDPDILYVGRLTYLDLIDIAALFNVVISDYNPFALKLGLQAPSYEKYTHAKFAAQISKRRKGTTRERNQNTRPYTCIELITDPAVNVGCLHINGWAIYWYVFEFRRMATPNELQTRNFDSLLVIPSAARNNMFFLEERLKF